jgi:Carbohydrate binding domain
MKKMIVSMMALLMVIGAFAGENLVKNGDFKAGSKGWYIPKKDVKLFLFLPESTMDGPYLKVIGAETPDKYARINNRLKGVKVQTGDEFILKAKIKCDKLSGKFSVMLRQANKDGKTVNYKGFAFKKRDEFEWKDFSKKVKIQPATTRLYIYIYGQFMAADDAVYVKNISVEKVVAQE